MEDILLTERFEEALRYAFGLHNDQRRKGGKIPYFAHLMGVAALVLEDGGSEDEAIAALLHDAVEDQGGIETLEEVRRKFGERVAKIVDGCTDAYSIPKRPWQERKEMYLAKLQYEPEETRRVALADKVYNARTTLLDLKEDGNQVWEKFRGGQEGTLWYYKALIDVFDQFGPSTLLTELKTIVAEMEAIAAGEKAGQDGEAQ